MSLWNSAMNVLGGKGMICSVLVTMVLTSGCVFEGAFQPPQTAHTEQMAYHPGTLSIYAVARDKASGARALLDVVRGRVWPSEVIIGAIEDTVPVITYTVKRG